MSGHSPTRWSVFMPCETPRCGAGRGVPCANLRGGGRRSRPHPGRTVAPGVVRPGRVPGGAALKVTDDQVREMRDRRAAAPRLPLQVLATDYGISISQVSHILARRSRADVR